MKTRSILSASQFIKNDLDMLLDKSEKIKNHLKTKKQIPVLTEYILATLFFEPSTRTRLSFESAMARLGGKCISSVGIQFSSLAKGETLYDTLRVIESYADICAIRHPVEGASAIAAESIGIPVINAGDGAGEHPTQGLLDLYTINSYKPLDKKTIMIGFVGDIKYGRTIHSLIQLLSHYNVEFIFISPPELSLPEKYQKQLDQKKIHYTITEKIETLNECDIGYITRIQEERFPDRMEYERFKNAYVINKEFLSKCNPGIKIMHPLPRLNEISPDVDKLPQAAYFDQAANGLYTRMALLLYVTNLLEHI